MYSTYSFSYRKTFEQVGHRLCALPALEESSRRMASNTALLGLIIGAVPSISDKELSSKKLVSHRPPPHPQHFIPQIPSLLLIKMIALLDWADDDTWLVSAF